MSGPAPDLHALASATGVRVHWQDVDGHARTVDDASLMAVLEALDRPAATAAQQRDSLRRGLEAQIGRASWRGRVFRAV